MTPEELENIIYNEGNFEEWRDEETGYLCRVIRPHDRGHLCGYVSVPESNLIFGKDYSCSFYDGPFYDIEVHGGLTYSDDMGVKGMWWLGFDCVHLGDLNPRDLIVYNHRFMDRDTDIYRDKKFVKEECRKLAKQLKALDNNTGVTRPLSEALNDLKNNDGL